MVELERAGLAVEEEVAAAAEEEEAEVEALRWRPLPAAVSCCVNKDLRACVCLLVAAVTGGRGSGLLSRLRLEEGRAGGGEGAAAREVFFEGVRCDVVFSLSLFSSSSPTAYHD